MNHLHKPSHDNGSMQVTEHRVIKNFEEKADNTFLVSFPRTGSHWLRMIMELYFETPSLVRVFYFHDKESYLTLHTHDLSLDVERKNVIYLYREPVDTVYSQLKYHQEKCDDQEKVTYWAELYANHLDKWLYKETFSSNKTILTYEGMQADITKEFTKICKHFDFEVDEQRLINVQKIISKEEVRKKTRHDSQVIRLEESYGLAREEFRRDFSNFIWSTLMKVNPSLASSFHSSIVPADLYNTNK